MKHIFRLRFLVLIAVVLVASSCHRSQSNTSTRHPFTGRIVSLDAQNQSAVIDGDNVPGFMDAMVMVYRIKPTATLGQLSPGDSISAQLVDMERGDDRARSDYWLENVKVTAHSKTPPVAPISTQRVPVPGDEVPDFSFTNQNGKRIYLHQYHGDVLLVTFIYTRCPFPDFCPRMTGNFAAIYKELAADPSLARVHLLTISFDPEHDTPKVLRDYAFSNAHTHERALFTRWEFAALSPKDLPKIAKSFGLIYKPENGLITHNLSTTVIGHDSKIVKWYHGGDWQVSDLIKDATDASRRH